MLDDVQMRLADEEYEALAGVWRTDLELDGGDTTFSLHLAAPTHPSGGGSVHALQKLPFNICQGTDGSSSSQWYAKSVEGDDGELCLSLRLGNLYLEGRGERHGLRCSVFSGTAFEGTQDPCVVGRFLMQLSLPISTNTTALNERFQHRLASRPLAPLAFLRSGLVGQWRLMLSMDEDTPAYYGHLAHAYFPITLGANAGANGMWESAESPGGEGERLAGTWGMQSLGGGGDPAIQSEGSHVWFKVHRERCSETLRGIAGLPVRSDFHMSGKPVMERAEQELAARVDAESGGGITVERIDGHLWEGDEERLYFGRFSLLRGWPTQLIEACDSGDDVACEGLSREEEAKRAWLAKHVAPTPAEACDKTADDVACEGLSREEEAKRAWLAGLEAARVQGTEAPTLAEVCDTGDDVACETLSREEEAKRAWLADRTPLSREEAAKRAWLAARDLL